MKIGIYLRVRLSRMRDAMAFAALACMLAYASGAAASASGTVGGAGQGEGGSAHVEGTGAASVVVPSIEILAAQTHLAGSCSGAPFDLNTFINVGSTASADVRLVTQAVGVLEEFTDETGSNIGPFNGTYSTFHILGFGGGIAPHSAIQLIITTYTGPALSGKSSYISAATFDCTSGVIASIANSATGTLPPVPALDEAALLGLAALLALLGMAALRRRTVRIR